MCRRRFCCRRKAGIAPAPPVRPQADGPGGAEGRQQTFDALAARLVELGGLHKEGIFRIPGPTKQLNKLQQQLAREPAAAAARVADSCSDVHTVAGLLQRWLRNLDSPVVPEPCHRLWDEAASQLETADAVSLRQMVWGLPVPQQRLLCALVKLLQQVDEVNTRMSPANLGKIFAPQLVRRDDVTVVVARLPFDSALVAKLIELLDTSEDIERPPAASSRITPCGKVSGHLVGKARWTLICEALDTAGAGTMAKPELRKCLEYYFKGQSITEDEVLNLVSEAAVDNGLVGWAEFFDTALAGQAAGEEAALAAVAAEETLTMHRLFRRLDADGSGRFISASELDRALHRHLKPDADGLTAEDEARILAVADQDHDGKVDYAEFEEVALSGKIRLGGRASGGGGGGGPAAAAAEAAEAAEAEAEGGEHELSRSMLLRLLRRIDSDDSGRIGRAELLTAVQVTQTWTSNMDCNPKLWPCSPRIVG